MKLVEVTGIPKISRKIKILRDTPFFRVLLSEIGMFAMHRIKKRTLHGEDVDGINFKPYSTKYALQRKKAGFPVRPVDLNRSGSMASSMTYTPGINSVDIFFMNTTDSKGVRNPEKAFFLQKDREFFALNAKDFKGIITIVENYYKKALI